jgi:hypothetical protein
MTDDELKSLVDQVVAVRPAGSNKPGATSFGGRTPTPEGSGGNSGNDNLTVAEFQKMNTSEKSQLYGRNPDLYNKLQKQTVGR